MAEENNHEHSHSESHQEKKEEKTITIKKSDLWKYSTFALLAVLVVALVMMSGDAGTGNAVAPTGQQPVQKSAQEYAEDLGYDIESCLSSGEYVSVVQRDTEDAKAAGGTGTPYFIVLKSGESEGVPVNGAQPYTVFSQVIESLLNGDTPEEGTVPVQVRDSPFRGDEKAPVTIVEFLDYNCGYCQRHSQQTLPSIKSDYIDSGDVKYVMKEFAVLGPDSLVKAQALHCVREQGGDEAYFEMHDSLFGLN